LAAWWDLCNVELEFKLGELDASPDVVVVVADMTDGVDINDCTEEVELLTLETYGGMLESLTLSGKRTT